MEKQRLDNILKDLNIFESREKAQKAIKQGQVKVNGKVYTSPSQKFDVLSQEQIEIQEEANKYVSRGAFKLVKALETFNISVSGKIATDIGSSTGGFSDVLLQNNIKKIYAIDVGKNQLHEKIKSNKKVVSMEETDFRTIKKSQIAGTNLVVIDVSFISILPIIQKLKELFKNAEVEIISLIKPQFECGKDIAKKYKGVIKDPKIHKQIIKNVLSFWQENGFKIKDITVSPIKGGDGNIEYLLYTANTGESITISDQDIEKLIFEAFG